MTYVYAHLPSTLCLIKKKRLGDRIGKNPMAQRDTCCLVNVSFKHYPLQVCFDRQRIIIILAHDPPLFSTKLQLPPTSISVRQSGVHIFDIVPLTSRQYFVLRCLSKSAFNPVSSTAWLIGLRNQIGICVDYFIEI